MMFNAAEKVTTPKKITKRELISIVNFKNQTQFLSDRTDGSYEIVQMLEGNVALVSTSFKLEQNTV